MRGIKKNLWVLIGVMIIVFMIGGCGDSGSKDNSSSSQSSASQSKEVVYAEADINQLLREAKENAAAANKNYKGKNVKITGGIVKNIESDVRYISLDGGEKFSLMHVQCFIDSDNKKLKDEVLNLKKGQSVTVYGNINEVGESLGYRVHLDKVEPIQ